MWDDFGEYILNYNHEKLNIAELAIGHFYDVSSYLESFENINLIKTDINPSRDDIIKDDLTNPNYKLYKDINLLYSIRPPNELQPYILDLAKKLNCTLLIKPLTGENLNTKLKIMKLKNYKKASFYIYTPKI